MICKAGGITKRDIGTIRIENRETHVELNAAVADRFFSHLGEGARLEKNIVAMPMREQNGRDEHQERRQRKDRPDRDTRPARQERRQERRPGAKAGPKPNKKKKTWHPAD
jgi:ATP-dependent RNA helicase DeaD